eukprot:TRINITY_DN16740_c0_g1_i1.p1 TRINITY_DN16740_c0_g1~~TRINITY_DN16740_c0_g1_i1.p1  ORF type:complete len:531 (-),score=80.28 TRINITY_DN16740_c0_g1_i1:456-2048(-)
MDLSWKTLLTDTYGVLWKMIIRPPRAEYSPEDLGPKKFRMGDKSFERNDLQLVNDRGLKLECSHFVPLRQKGKGKPDSMPCVIYLHGNCSSRLEASDTLQVLLPRDISVFSLDLSGSGLSEGEFISLGHFEERDLQTVIDYLRKLDEVSAVGVWGRSMGAATTILRAGKDWSIAGCVLDSPFSSLRLVAEELVNSGMVTVPDFLLSAALQMVRSEIQSRANFDIEQLVPAKSACLARSPVLFGHASDDDFVGPHHTLKLHNAWGGSERKMVTFTGGHNGPRPPWFVKLAGDFLEDRLRDAAGIRASRAEEALGKAPQPVPWEFAESPLPPPPPSPRQETPNSPAASVGHNRPTPSKPVPPVSEPHDDGSPVAKASQAPLSRQNATPEAIRAAKLVSMGFSEDMAVTAASRYSNVEEAIEWILRHSMQIMQESAQTLGRVELRAPTRADTVVASTVTPQPTPPKAAPAAAAQAGYSSERAKAAPASFAPNADVLVAQLMEFGCTLPQAREAARRNSTAEAAVEWLAKRGEL